MDKGAKFVIENLRKCLDNAIQYNRGKKTIAKLRAELKRLINFQKTGNMYQHFLKFQDQRHPNVDLFKWCDNYGIIRNEDMAAYLFHHFRDEIGNYEYWWDWDIGSEVTMPKICAFFGGQEQSGGIRFKKDTNQIVIVSSPYAQHRYVDKWDNGILKYIWFNNTTKSSHRQKMLSIFKQHALKDSKIILFEKMPNKLYKFHGVALCENYEFLNNNLTLIVHLKPIGNVVDYEDLKNMVLNLEKRIVQQCDDDTLIDLALASQKKHPIFKNTKARIYTRDPSVSLFAKKRANGVCDLCGKHAPFLTIEKIPYLETHHVKPLSENGPDSVYNVVALCPNCHRKIHVLKDKKEIEKLIAKIKTYLLASEKMKSQILDWKKLFGR